VRRSAVFGAAVVCTALAVASGTTATPRDTSTAVAGCGGTRARVKTLSDALARTVSTRPKDTTVAALRRLRAPRRLTAKTLRRPGPERTTYRVQTRMVEMKLEPDGDIILVVLDPKTKGKLAAEFPSDSCTRRASKPNRKPMRTARAALLAACGKPDPMGSEIGGSATVTGVGFFERGDGADRESPNGFELHPVLGFQGKCALGA
jgi:hypothetical protein